MYKVFGYLIISLFVTSVYGQQYLDQVVPSRWYHDGVQLYGEGAYQASAILLEKYLESDKGQAFETEASFYLGLDRFLIDKEKTQALTDFATKNRNHPLASLAYFNLGVSAFDQGKYNKALENFKLVNEQQLEFNQLIELLFKRGYALMKAEDDAGAIADYKQVILNKEDYYLEAVYYSGLIYTQKKRYSEALDILKEADESNPEGAYAPLISELIANIYYQTEKYPELLTYTSQKLTDAPTQTNRILNRLMGETYFKNQEYRPAARHFQRHLDLSKKKMDADGYYKLGYSYYKTGQDDKAIDNFKLAALDKGELGQSSSFYLGQLYLKAKNYSYALSAFKTVIGQGANEAMKEEATFIVGKINYTTNQYAEAIVNLKSFLDKYPDSKWTTEASELLTQSFLRTSDYDQAITYIESVQRKTNTLQKAYQSVSLLKGQQLFNDSKFERAITYLTKSLTFQVDPTLTAEAYYLQAESYSMTGNIEAAKKSYQNCKRINATNEWGILSNYGLGYLAYNQKSFPEAEVEFKTFVRLAPATHRFYSDAKLRLADCLFVQKQYDAAIQAYASLLNIDMMPQDYVQYQLGITYTLSGQPAKARLAFANVVGASDKSAYKDNALFQMGETHISEASFAKASEMFSQLIKEYPESPLVPFSYSRRALCSFNQNKNKAAKEDYEYILTHFITAPMANDALLGLQELIKRGVKVERFDDYMEAFQLANPNDGSLEVIAFESSKNKYYAQQYNEAIESLKKFTEKYPESSFSADAAYFLADSYYRLGDWDRASEKFKLIIDGEHNAYKVRALDKRGKALKEVKNYDAMLKNYHFLLRFSSSKKEEFLAYEGLMNGHLFLGKLDSAIHYANMILKGDWKPVGVTEQVSLVKGKALFGQAKYALATDEFIKVINGPIDENAVEAKYFMANVLYKQQSYNKSLEMLFELNRNYGSYPYWIGKSFLLISDNYLALGELLQSKATLKSVIENSPEKDIVAEAKKKMVNVETAEKSVLTQDSTIQKAKTKIKP